MIESEPTNSEILWLKNNISTFKTVEFNNGFEDLALLDSIIGEAKIVSLGEATHGTKEIYQMKHRIIDYLALKKGFDILAIEALMPEAYKLNEYLLYGLGEPKELLANLSSWTYNTLEVLEMILWMRDFNKSCKSKIIFTGFDMQAIKGSLSNLKAFATKEDKTLLPLLANLEKLEKERFELVKIFFDITLAKIKACKNEKEKQKLTKKIPLIPDYIYKELTFNITKIHNKIVTNKKKYLLSLSSYEYEFLKQNATLISQYINLLSVDDFKASNRLRDHYMAENVKWLVANNPQSKIILWGHNGHVNRRKDWLGGFLDEFYGSEMKVVGFAIGEGTYTAIDLEKGLNSENILEQPMVGSVEYYFQKTQEPLFMLELNKVKSHNDDSKWLLKKKLVRTTGAVVNKKEEFYLDKITDLYDAIIYIQKTNSSVLIKK